MPELSIDDMIHALDESDKHVKKARDAADGGATDDALHALVAAQYETNEVVRQIVKDYDIETG